MSRRVGNEFAKTGEIHIVRFNELDAALNEYGRSYIEYGENVRSDPAQWRNVASTGFDFKLML